MCGEIGGFAHEQLRVSHKADGDEFVYDREGTYMEPLGTLLCTCILESRSEGV